MDKRLYNAAVKGDVKSLLRLVEVEDPLLLDRCMATSSVAETPLHLSAMLGHEEFTKVLLKLKPELAGELNSDGATALHLASAKGYVEIVKELVSVNSDMCLKRDCNGLTPLHVATLKGRLVVMRELVRARADAARAPVDGGGATVLHLCVRHNQLDALKLLLETMKPDGEFLNSKDVYGNTILHCAVANNSVEMITYLVNNKSIKANEVNGNGFTALDIIAQSRLEAKVGEHLRSAGAERANDRNAPNSTPRTERAATQPTEEYQEKRKEWTEKNRNALMVVASLIATMAFQVGVNPPGSYWQDNSNGHVPGKSIMSKENPDLYQELMSYNTVSFLGALSIILLLISGLPMRRRFFVWVLIVFMWITVSSTALTYSLAITGVDVFTSSFTDYVAGGIILCWILLLMLIVLLHIIRLIWKIVRWFRKRRTGGASANSLRLGTPSTNLGPTSV